MVCSDFLPSGPTSFEVFNGSYTVLAISRLIFFVIQFANSCSFSVNESFAVATSAFAAFSAEVSASMVSLAVVTACSKSVSFAFAVANAAARFACSASEPLTLASSCEMLLANSASIIANVFPTISTPCAWKGWRSAAYVLRAGSAIETSMVRQPSGNDSKLPSAFATSAHLLTAAFFNAFSAFSMPPVDALFVPLGAMANE
mmetsp:Transcript_16842/g.27280  ORF Transcript_16842/g.27280 Transcript_16842/m.27280 type:complete len:202 (+) Transcript_16842:698-1303(+)